MTAVTTMTLMATTHPPSDPKSVVIGLDLPGNDLAKLEHRTLTWLDEEGIAAVEVATHILDGRYVASVAIAADVPRALATAAHRGFVVALPAMLADGVICPVETPLGRAVAAASNHYRRTGGRLVHFAGDALTKGTQVGAANLVVSSAIDEIVVLGATAGPDAVVVTNGFARPMMQSGRTVLVVTPFGDDRFRPFETQNPHRCCGGH